MNNTNTTFIFAVLVHNTGSIAFFPNSTTFGEIAKCYEDSRVTYMPHFQLEKTDVLYYQDEPFTSFEALFNTYGEEALTHTYIYSNQPKYDITNKAILVDSGDDIEEVQLTLFALGCVWSGDIQGELLDELYGTNVEIVFFIDDNKEMTWATSYLAHVEGIMDEANILTFNELTRALQTNEDEMDAAKEVVSSYFIHDLDKDMVFEWVLLEGMALSYKGSVYYSYNSLVDEHGEQALNKATCISSPSSPSSSSEIDADYYSIPF